MCWNTASSSAERSEYDALVLTGSDSLPVPDKLTKAIVPKVIIACVALICNNRVVKLWLLFELFGNDSG